EAFAGTGGARRCRHRFHDCAGYRAESVFLIASRDRGRRLMKRLMQLIALVLLLLHATARAGEATQNAFAPQLREEIWAIPSAVPMLAYMIRPAGEGPFPLLVMNHGVSLDRK